MKIKTIEKDYEEVMSLNKAVHKNPIKPALTFRLLMKLAGAGDLKDANFSYTSDIEKAGKGPYLILMNHSSFIDLEMVSEIMYPNPYCIVCTNDGFVGKEWLMRNLGCIPTHKFVTDFSLILDMEYALHDLKTSVLMYPEASYTFDGCPTPLPRHMGTLLKRFKVPVVMIKTEGAFARDPLYNCLQKRKVKVSANVSCLLTREEIATKKASEIDAILDEAFTFDNFRWQSENKIKIDEPFRADGLNRILFRCPDCGKEGYMEGKGTSLTCHNCGKTYTLTEYGKLAADDGDARFEHIPDWYKWERECVRKEIEDGTYRLDIPVKIGILMDYKSIYMVGSGRLVHTCEGFDLTGCEGKLSYHQSPLACYGLYADYYWYEIGDMICIGNNDVLYYCFPDEGTDVVAKTRMAAEEMYKMKRNQ